MLKICALVILVTNYAYCSAHIESINHFQSGNENTLQNDFGDFIDLLPIEDIRNLTIYFYTNDEAMRKSYDYLRNDGYKMIVNQLSQVEVFRKFVSIFNDSGINLKELNKKMERIVLTNEETDAIVVSEGSKSMGGIDAYFNECLLLIPRDEILMTFFTKMEKSNAFSSFLEKIAVSHSLNLLQDMEPPENLKILVFEMALHGINLFEWMKHLKNFSGI